MTIKSLAPNMTQLDMCEKGIVLFSYNTPVAFLFCGKFFVTAKKWSRTTSRHIHSWAGYKAIVKPQEFFDDLVV